MAACLQRQLIISVGSLERNKPTTGEWTDCTCFSSAIAGYPPEVVATFTLTSPTKSQAPEENRHAPSYRSASGLQRDEKSAQKMRGRGVGTVGVRVRGLTASVLDWTTRVTALASGFDHFRARTRLPPPKIEPRSALVWGCSAWLLGVW